MGISQASRKSGARFVLGQTTHIKIKAETSFCGLATQKNTLTRRVVFKAKLAPPFFPPAVCVRPSGGTVTLNQAGAATFRPRRGDDENDEITKK